MSSVYHVKCECLVHACVCSILLMYHFYFLVEGLVISCLLLWSALIILILSLCSALMRVYVGFELELEFCDLW